ncbi:hypothetical protein CTAYLR_000369 [Chrysophaeum taylorii]|uniref:Cytochrome b5 heme-binding domain-containing protein n=1 Tax=Chrysophaeum taylorii TaxID=2483200 RepID=A0AAD7UID7_9STRA|nr:hypothetical protein CTAYLR_000369 [Chrysophaeum taylorii]
MSRVVGSRRGAWSAAVVVGGGVAVVGCNNYSRAQELVLLKKNPIEWVFRSWSSSKSAAPRTQAWAAELKAKQEHPGHSKLDGNRVVVELDAETLEALPTMSLEEVEASRDSERPLVSYEGIVYDVSEFVSAHPGGRELLLTATGCDLSHFFENYTVHADSDKAARWLASMAVGKMSATEAALAAKKTTSEVHATRRMERLRRARRRLAGIVAVLPACIVARAAIRLLGRFVSSRLARWLATLVPAIAIPGYSAGSEPMKKGKVAVVGGGIAGCGAAWMLARDGFEVYLYEARPNLSGNARTFDWDGFGDGRPRKSCVSVTAWPSILYKNYEALLDELEVETTPMPLSWLLVSKVPGYEGSLWGADPRPQSLRTVFADDFVRYERVISMVDRVTAFLTGTRDSMYANHAGLGVLNPFNVVPLYRVCRLFGVSDAWWDIVFTPYYTASFLVDELRPFPAVFGPIIQRQIPLIPTPDTTWHGADRLKGPNHCKLTTCVTWKNAGNGIREVFEKLVRRVDVSLDTRVLSVHVLDDGSKRVVDDKDGVRVVDRVVFACPCNAITTILENRGPVEDVILASPDYADDRHPSSGHMHAVMHSDPSVIDPAYREDFLNRGSNYVEVTAPSSSSGKINIENQYNFGVQTPGHGVYEMPLDQKPVMLISHALGEGKSIDPEKIRGGGNHARAHPLYSPWNVAAQLSLRLCQGRDGIYYCSNWTTPGNCHDMSLVSGFLCAHAIGADYPWHDAAEAKNDFYRLNDLMGVF